MASVNCEAKHVFSANKHKYSACMYIICPHNTGGGTNANINNNNGLMLLLFLDDQAECLQTYIYAYNI